MARSPSLCGIILAAGASSRMGREKALLPWPPGHPGGLRNTLLGAWIELLRPHTDMVIVVGGANSHKLEPIVYSIGGFLVENRAPATWPVQFAQNRTAGGSGTRTRFRDRCAGRSPACPARDHEPSSLGVPGRLWSKVFGRWCLSTTDTTDIRSCLHAR